MTTRLEVMVIRIKFGKKISSLNTLRNLVVKKVRKYKGQPIQSKFNYFNLLITLTASGNFPQRPDQPSSSGSSTASSSSISTPPSSDKIQENESKDELVQFVENDIQRIERLKRRYSLSDEGDDPTFGFGRRPLVRGIKPRYGTTDEIIRHMQMQLQPSIPSQPVVAPQNTPRQAIVIDTQAL